MPSAYHVHPEFGYFCPTPYRRRELRVAIVSILFGAMIGGSIATLRAGHDRNPDGVSTAAHVPNSERVLAAAARPRLRRRTTRRPRQRSPSSPFRCGACACVQPCRTHPSRQRMPQPSHRPE
jgi:hypothetical protein